MTHCWEGDWGRSALLFIQYNVGSLEIVYTETTKINSVGHMFIFCIHIHIHTNVNAYIHSYMQTPVHVTTIIKETKAIYLLMKQYVKC